MKWHPFEHSLYRHLKELGIVEKHLLIAVSGGRDSVALFWSLNSLKTALGLKIEVVHVHHGIFENQVFREQAKSFVKDICAKTNVKFHLKQNKSRLLKSESDFRKLRYQFFSEMQKKIKCDYVLTAHHSMDLLETRLIRLIRGTSQSGLPAILPIRGYLLRPFLVFSPIEIKGYLKDKNLNWLDDPSNQESKYLRNWLRNKWLPLLEKRRGGALVSLSRSLDLISKEESVNIQDLRSQIGSEKGWRRSLFLQLSAKEQFLVLSDYLKNMKIDSFSKNHLLEIIKHLDSSKKVHTFFCAGCEWRINAGHFIAYPRLGK